MKSMVKFSYIVLGTMFVKSESQIDDPFQADQGGVDGLGGRVDYRPTM